MELRDKTEVGKLLWTSEEKSRNIVSSEPTNSVDMTHENSRIQMTRQILEASSVV